MKMFKNIFKINNAWNETLIKEMCIIAKLENSEDGIEGDVIVDAIKEFKIDTERAIYIMDNPSKIDTIYPTQEEDKITYLTYLLKLIVANKIVSDIEKRTLLFVSEKLELDIDFVKQIIMNLELMTFNQNYLMEYMNVEIERVLEFDISLLKNNNKKYSKEELTEIYGKEGVLLLKECDSIFQEQYMQFFKENTYSEDIFHQFIGLSCALVYTRCGENDNSTFFKLVMENLFIELTIMKKISQ